MKKHYGLTKKPNEGVQDNAPEWLNSFFEKSMTKTASSKNLNPFAGVDDKRLNPSLEGLNKIASCEKCNCDLKDSEVDICEQCSCEK